MEPRRIIALLLIALGILAVLAGPQLPGAQRLVAMGPPTKAHVTALTRGDAGALIAATQTGEVWRHEGDGWIRMQLGLDERVITALAGEPGPYPVGTASGLWPAPRPPLTGAPRILDLLETERGLLLATDKGLRVLADDSWHAPGAQANGYRLEAQQNDGIRYLHMGTIGDGVYSAPAPEMLGDWQVNSAGLPAGVKVLSFAVTQGGLLLAGTDSGLYWQARPGETWQALDLGLGEQRVLAMLVESLDEDPTADQRLWIGTDDGLATVALTEDPQGLSTAGPTRDLAVRKGDPAPGVAVGEIVRAGNRLVVSAGSVYELTAVRPPSWYLLSLAGLGLAVLGAWIGLRQAGKGNAD